MYCTCECISISPLHNLTHCIPISTPQASVPATEASPGIATHDATVTKSITLRMQLAGGSWSGMFWRGDPVTNKKPPNQKNWPRNGSILRGVPVKAKGNLWLKVFVLVHSFKRLFSFEIFNVMDIRRFFRFNKVIQVGLKMYKKVVIFLTATIIALSYIKWVHYNDRRHLFCVHTLNTFEICVVFAYEAPVWMMDKGWK